MDKTAARKLAILKAQTKVREEAEAAADRIIRELAAEFKRWRMSYYELAQIVGGGSQINLKAVLEGKEQPGLVRVLAIAMALGKTLAIKDY